MLASKIFLLFMALVLSELQRFGHSGVKTTAQHLATKIGSSRLVDDNLDTNTDNPQGNADRQTMSFVRPLFVDEEDSTPASTDPPWYLNDLQGMNITFTEANLTYSENLKIEQMLMESRNILDPIGLENRGFPLRISNILYKMKPSPEMKRALSDLNLCGQADVMRRISCRDRCGQVHDVIDVPAQCGCDDKCFAFGDCCEDIHKLCTNDFVRAVTEYYDQREFARFVQCHTVTLFALTNLYKLEQTHPTGQPQNYEIVCQSEVSKDDFLKNMIATLDAANCSFTSFGNHQDKVGRVCDRPDVLVCGSQDGPNVYSFFPVHLLCFNHPKTFKISTRYHTGPEGMEVISRGGNCTHLRQASSSSMTAKNRGDSKRHAWHRAHLKELQLTIVPGPGHIYFHFRAAEWERVRCTTELTAPEWECEKFECADNQIFDETIQTCYIPDYAYLQVIFPDHQPRSGADTGNTSGDCFSHDQLNSSSPDNSKAQTKASTRPSSGFYLCSCLKAQSALNMVSLWQVTAETDSLLSESCRFKLNTASSGQISINPNRDEVNGTHISNQTSFNQTIFSRDMNDVDAFRAVNLSSKSYLSLQLQKTWNKLRGECVEEKHIDFKICFTSTRWSAMEPICFRLQESTYLGLRDLGLEAKIVFDPENSNSATGTFVRLGQRYTLTMVYAGALSLFFSRK